MKTSCVKKFKEIYFARIESCNKKRTVSHVGISKFTRQIGRRPLFPHQQRRKIHLPLLSASYLLYLTSYLLVSEKNSTYKRTQFETKLKIIAPNQNYAAEINVKYKKYICNKNVSRQTKRKPCKKKNEVEFLLNYKTFEK